MGRTAAVLISTQVARSLCRAAGGIGGGGKRRSSGAGRALGGERLVLLLSGLNPPCRWPRPASPPSSPCRLAPCNTQTAARATHILTESPMAQVLVYFLMHFLALEEEIQPDLMLAWQVDISCGGGGGGGWGVERG